MRLSNLEIFCVVAQVKSFSRAAKLLYLTQPTVSSQIQYMENYYGTRLFERTAQGVVLTEAGKVVHEYARRLLDLHDEMEKQLDRLVHADHPTLVVGASSTMGNYALPCSVYTFKEKFPEVDVRLEVANTEEILRRVAGDSIDLGIVEGPVEAPGIVSHKIFADEMVLIAPPREPWLSMEYAPVEMLKKEPFILREPGSGTRRVLERSLAAIGITTRHLNVVAEMGSIDAIKSAVESGLGVSMIPRLAARKEIIKGMLVALPIEDLSIPTDIHVVLREEKQQPSIATRFIRFIAAPEERSFC